MVEVASGLYLGERLLQQDSIATFEHRPTGTWLLALSDGIGGAGNGHLASRLIVRSAMASLKLHVGDLASGAEAGDILQSAAQAANRSLASMVERHPDKSGMGGTLLLAIVSARRFHYLSIGDSIVFHLSSGAIKRVNTLHSLAGGVDALTTSGRLDANLARSAAMRSTLTSALTGGRISQVDAPKAGIPIASGDVLLLASDGIETLSEAELPEVLQSAPLEGAASAAATLIARVERAAAPRQDNVSVIVTSG